MLSYHLVHYRPFDGGIEAPCKVLRAIMEVRPQCRDAFKSYYLLTIVDGSKLSAPFCQQLSLGQALQPSTNVAKSKFRFIVL